MIELFKRAVSSLVERSVHIGKAIGPIPILPTHESKVQQTFLDRAFKDKNASVWAFKAKAFRYTL